MIVTVDHSTLRLSPIRVTTEHCEFCEGSPKWRFEPSSEALRAVWGHRLTCEKHAAWTRRLLYLDLGPVLYRFIPVGECS